jgi:hypothetical protein
MFPSGGGRLGFVASAGSRLKGIIYFIINNLYPKTTANVRSAVPVGPPWEEKPAAGRQKWDGDV